VQDDFRIRERLTLNFGVRWEAELPRSVDGNRMNAFDPAAINPVSGTPGVVTFAGLDGVPHTAFDANYHNFAPRFGFAWRAPFAKNLVLRGGGGLFFGPMVSNSVGPAASLGFGDALSLVAASPDTTWALGMRSGFPVYTRPAIGSSGFGAVAAGGKTTTAVTYFDRARPTPVSYQFNFEVQDEVAPNLVVEAGYLGNIGRHLTASDLSINQVAPQLLGPGNLQALRPFPQFSNVSMINPPVGNSSYHAGFVKVERRFSHGLSLLAHYTFSKFLDDAASANEIGDPGSYMDAYNRRLDKGLSGSDIPHRGVITLLYAAPAVTRSRVVRAATGGWQMGLLTVLQSGAPFTVYDSVNQSNAFAAGTMRPDRIADAGVSEPTLGRWFNTAAFRSAAPYTFGNSPRSVGRGPAWRNVDLTVARNFKVRERLHTEVRGEFFNVINRANFDLPGHTLGNADFGVISSTEAARTVQLGLRLLF
jgi:hypothetical protein